MVHDKLEMDVGKLDWEKFKTGKYVIISAPIESSENDADAAFYKIGDSIKVKLPDESIKLYEVMGIGNVPYAMGPGFSNSVEISILIPSDEYLLHSQNKGAMKLFIDADDVHINEVESLLTNYCEKTKPLLDFESRNKYKEGFKEMKQTFLLIGSAMSLILALIGILNFINLNIYINKRTT